ncbi:hypothetical protein R1T16_14145 [Flavobacterium sp. DG1-102-2]|uniref:hypothetical protein n=1 Tax=Flavobacterium sp. DG1-102-2 TaxID=3081663 RepID=UPI00294A5F34|nr:hypothetical protein [Flavobacterium sp. DG1-102-2]MDV6169573.1 hypothetical protein [Flavobacterium sp. DG1-102-2]
MKNIISLLFVLCATIAAAQTDANGNPVFNSITINSRSLKNGVEMSINYYTLKNNIENKGSSVFVNEKPSKEQVITAATRLPSDYFIIRANSSASAMLMFTTYPVTQILVVNPSTGDVRQFPTDIKGDITENRANEIIKEGYDPAATLKNGKLTFNGKTYNVISNTAINKEIIALIDKEKLLDTPASDMVMLSSGEIKKIMLTETAEGGKFDYFTPIKGKEYNSVQVKPGVFSTELGVALYRWVRAAYTLGVNTPADALAVFAEFKGRPVNKREEEYITMGFNKELEK